MTPDLEGKLNACRQAADVAGYAHDNRVPVRPSYPGSVTGGSQSSMSHVGPGVTDDRGERKRRTKRTIEKLLNELQQLNNDDV
eukprot:4296385-Prorocentrum_lima.AAC.1